MKFRIAAATAAIFCTLGGAAEAKTWEFSGGPGLPAGWVSKMNTPIVSNGALHVWQTWDAWGNGNYANGVRSATPIRPPFCVKIRAKMDRVRGGVHAFYAWPTVGDYSATHGAEIDGFEMAWNPEGISQLHGPSGQNYGRRITLNGGWNTYKMVLRSNGVASTYVNGNRKSNGYVGLSSGQWRIDMNTWAGDGRWASANVGTGVPQIAMMSIDKAVVNHKASC